MVGNGPETTPEGSPFITRRGNVRLDGQMWDGSGPTMILVHGLASTRHIWDLAVGHLVPDFRVVAYDQRGHGASSKPRTGYGFDGICADLGAVVRRAGARRGNGRPVLVGHSWGANVVLEFAVEHPGMAAGIVCVDGGFGALSDHLDWPSARELLAPPKIGGMPAERLLGLMRDGQRELWSDDVERVMRSLVRVDSRGRAWPRLARTNHFKILRAMYSQHPVELHRRLDSPALVLAARPRKNAEGPEAGFYDLKRRFEPAIRRAGASWRWITSVHDVPLDRPKELARLLAQFARSLRSI